jgi:seryl-tRNA synthetase
MLDLKWIRENPDALDAALARRKAAPLAAVVVDLDRRNRATVTELQALQSRRNEVSKQIGGIKAKGGDAGPLWPKWPRSRTR